MKQTTFLIFIAGALAAAPADAESPSLRVWDTNAETSEATANVHATPAAIYQAVTDYARWSGLFSDVKWARVLSGGPENATVKFESQTLEREVTVRFDNDRGNVRFRLVDGPPGVQSIGEFVAEPGRDSTTTRIRGRLFMNANFPASLVVSGKKLVWMRQTKLRRDLEDLQKRFP